MSDPPAEIAPARLSRRLVRSAERAALATLAYGRGAAGGTWPYASLVLAACSHDASPLLLISDLADHTRNLRQDPRVSLLFDGTAGLDDPLTGPRVSLQGEAEAIDDPALLARYLRRHPSAEMYAGFKDFHLFRVRPARAHLVAGFGRIERIGAEDMVFDTVTAEAFSSDELQIISALNAGNGETLDILASRLLGRDDSGWRLAGIDPEGADLRRGGALGRLDFAGAVATPQAARDEILRLAAAVRNSR